MTQVRADGLAAALARGLPPVVWIHGDEPLLVLEAADATRAAARAAISIYADLPNYRTNWKHCGI